MKHLEQTTHHNEKERFAALTRLYGILSHINQVITRTTDMQSLFDETCRVIVDYGEFRFCWIGMVDKETRTVKPAAYYGPASKYLEGLEIKTTDTVLGQGPTGTAIREDHFTVCEDIETDPHMKPWRERALSYGLRSSAAFPIYTSGKAVGAISFYSNRPMHFEDNEIRLLYEISACVSFALDNLEEKRKAEEAEKTIVQERDKAQQYLDVANVIFVVINRDGKVILINEKGCEILGYKEEEIVGKNWFRNFLPKSIRNQVETLFNDLIEGRLQPVTGVPETYENPVLTKQGEERLIQWHNNLIRDDKDNIISTISSGIDITDQKKAETREKEANKEIEHLASFPLLNPNPTIELDDEGNIVYTNPACKTLLKNVRSKRGMKALIPNNIKTIVKQLASGEIDHAVEEIKIGSRTFEEHISWFNQTNTARAYATDITNRKKSEQMAQDSLKQLQQALTGTVSAVAMLTETRDPYTAGHQRRVTQLADAIAIEMGLPEDKAQGLHVAAAVHDVGKIHVPAEILSKPGRLSEMEFEIIKTHPQFGFEILKSVDFPWPVAKIILDHHERLNGSGYPSGLKDGQLMLETKIISVADVVEAMSSHRPYRPSLGLEAALEEIQKNAGRLYDQEIVDICLELFTKKKFRFK